MRGLRAGLGITLLFWLRLTLFLLGAKYRPEQEQQYEHQGQASSLSEPLLHFHDLLSCSRWRLYNCLLQTRVPAARALSIWGETHYLRLFMYSAIALAWASSTPDIAFL